MALTKATFSMVQKAPVNIKDYGATGDRNTDDTAAIQAAINAAVADGVSLYVPAGNYRVSSTLTVGAFPDTFLIQGQEGLSSVGSPARFLQGNTNAPLFDVNCVAISIRDLTFSIWSGKNTAKVSSYTYDAINDVGTLTLNSNPEPVLFTNLAYDVAATNGYQYTSTVAYCACVGGFLFDSITDNGNGTITLNNIRGTDGFVTSNALLASTVGQPITFNRSYEAYRDISSYTSPKASVIFLENSEPCVFENLYFHQVHHCFRMNATGSGGGPGLGKPVFGYGVNLNIDQAISTIWANDTMKFAQITNTNFSDCKFGAIVGDTVEQLMVSNSTQAVGKLVYCRVLKQSKIDGFLFPGIVAGQGYSDRVIDTTINGLGTVTDVTISNCIFGSCSDNVPTIILGQTRGLTFTGNTSFTSAYSVGVPTTGLIYVPTGGNLNSCSFVGNAFKTKIDLIPTIQQGPELFFDEPNSTTNVYQCVFESNTTGDRASTIQKVPPGVVTTNHTVNTSVYGTYTFFDSTGAQGEWISFTPGYGSDIGNQTATFSGSVTTTLARYKKIGQTLYIEIAFTGTLNAVTPAYLYFGLPNLYTFKSTGYANGATVKNNGAYAVGVIEGDVAGGSQMKIYKGDYSAFTSASAVGAKLSAVLEIT